MKRMVSSVFVPLGIHEDNIIYQEAVSSLTKTKKYKLITLMFDDKNLDHETVKVQLKEFKNKLKTYIEGKGGSVEIIYVGILEMSKNKTLYCEIAVLNKMFITLRSINSLWGHGCISIKKSKY